MATLNSSNITDGNTIEPNDLLQLYDAFTSGGGTTGVYSVSISGSLTGSASTAISSSYAVTASYALNGGGGTVTQINSQGYSNIGAGPVEATFKFYAGKVRMVSNSGTTADFPGLAGKTLGTNAWVTATIQGQASSFTAPNLVTVRSLSANGAITIETASVPDSTEVHYHVIYVPS
jgi:hypothetical protein